MRRVHREAGGAKYRILEGAVRSAKSYTANDVAIAEIQKLPPCKVLMSGYSISSVARNVLAEWKEEIDPYGKNLFRNERDGKDDYMVIDWRGLRGKKFYVRGAGKDHDHKQIQGATFGYWYADEVTRHCENFVDMAMTRLSPPWAKSIWTTNPDSPFHFVKKRFLDKKDLFAVDADEMALFRQWTFYLEDNPSLAPEYIDNLKRIYTGVFYKRYILSMWVVAEGSIYDFFDENIHIIDRPPRAKFYVIGCDYGTGAPTAAILFGVNPETRPRIWAEREWYWDSKEHERQMTDEEYSREIRAWIDKYKGGKKVRRFYLDPSSASFRVQLRRDKLNARYADNAVLDGIRTQARMLKNGEYAICRACKQTALDYNGYVWDEKAQLKGEDKPVKKNDHTKDAERYVLHSMFGTSTLDYNALLKM
jgi:PBSX family phage terminase large subunit